LPSDDFRPVIGGVSGCDPAIIVKGKPLSERYIPL
jgi:hypothetical protein